MTRSASILVTGGLVLAAALTLSGCGKKAGDTGTNIVEMNASDGSMNDMTVVESATLDQAGGTAATDNGADAGNASNAN